ncbi:Histone-lysine N-methyltransferase, partial [Coemansia furcata]
MVFLAARFAHHLGTPDFLESFLTDTIASIIHEVQTHKTDPVALGFWMSNIQTLVYFLKRDTTLVQATSEAQGRLSECMQDAYALLIRAVERELEPLIDASLLAFESMPELFSDVAFEVEKPQLSSQQRLSSFFFGSSVTTPTTDPTLPRKSSDGRPLRRNQTVLQKGRSRRGSLLAAVRPAPVGGPASASGEVPTWITCIERLRMASQPVQQQQPARSSNSGSAGRHRPTSGDTFVSIRNSQEMSRPPSSASGTASTSTLFSGPSPRTVTYILECVLDLLDMCEIHPVVTWGIVRQIFCYLGSEAFNRVLTTREFCSRSRAMQIRMNLTQLNDWVR